MTFTADETGYDTANPIELYLFTGSLDVYAYTSSNREVTYGSNVFKPVPIGRNEIILGDVTEKNELKVTMPITAKLVKDYGFDIPPPVLYLQVFRLHGEGGAVQPWFNGRVTSIVMEGRKASLVIPSVFSAYMSSEFPNVVFQSQCNHVLYGVRCSVDRTDFQLDGTVAHITDDVHITVTEAADKPNGWLKAGEIITTTERRLIVEHDGANLTLNYPFRSMEVGQTVTAFAGCDHSIQVCDDKFDNLVNFLGFPYTPSLNPFLVGLR